jgi:hypothetical protein
MKRTYIPRGAHQQGRIARTGVWLPPRADGTPEAAHAATATTAGAAVLCVALFG